MNSKIITEDEDVTIVQCSILRETDKALMINGTKGEPVWLPKSQIEINRTFDHDELVIPNWMITEKDIV